LNKTFIIFRQSFHTKAVLMQVSVSKYSQNHHFFPFLTKFFSIMSKNLLLTLLALWMAGSALWHAFVIKNCSNSSGAVANIAAGVAPLSIMDGDKLSLTAGGNFGFKKSDANPNMGMVQSELDSLVAYLKANPVRKVTITGTYAKDETNSTKYENLGIARAESIKDYLVKSGLPADRFDTGGKMVDSLTWSPTDSTSGLIDFGFAGLAAPKAGTTEEDLAKAEKFEAIFKPMDLYFKTGGADYIKTDDNTKFMEEATKYLAANKDSEGADAGNMKLSERRSKDVKAALSKKGISADQITTDAKGETQPVADNSTVEGRKQNRRVTVVVQ
jgi:OmpA-OmpF porin, OOP family